MYLLDLFEGVEEAIEIPHEEKRGDHQKKKFCINKFR